VKIFISWSGDSSRRIAEALDKWLRRVIQAVKPFVSFDLEKGKRWSSEIAAELEQSTFGIIILTPDNIGQEWLLFESGALSKRIADARVFTYLCGGLKPPDISGPLAQFQHTVSTKDDTLRLVGNINALLGAAALREEDLAETFERWWPELEAALVEALRTTPKPQKRSSDDLLSEVLTIVRDLQRRAGPRRGASILIDSALSAPPAPVLGIATIKIEAQVSNRREAILSCGLCHGQVGIHFYEGDGEPKLNDVLGLFHYDKCPGVPIAGGHIGIVVIREEDKPEYGMYAAPRRDTSEYASTH
jgi:hypothetical protein